MTSINCSCACWTAAPATCTTFVDVIFVLDSSGSIDSSSYTRMKEFVSLILNNMDIESGAVRVGLLKYSTAVDASFNLNSYSTRAAVLSALRDLAYSSGQTNTHSALAFVRQQMLQPSAGDRASVPNVVVVLTDAGSTDRTATQVKAPPPSVPIHMTPKRKHVCLRLLAS